MTKVGWLAPRCYPISCGLNSLILYLALAEASFGQSAGLSMSPAAPPVGSTATDHIHFAAEMPTIDRDRAAPSHAPGAVAQSAPSSVINVEDLQPTPMGFVTAAETLQGVVSPTNPLLEAPSPVIEPRNLRSQARDFEVSTDPPYRPATQAFDIEDYVPEPEPSTLVEVNTDVATTPDEAVEWRATLWGGIMTDNDLSDSVTFRNVELEDSGILGLGISRTVAGGNTVKVEGELQLLRHIGRQEHFEGTAALALRWQLSPSFSVALIEGVSYATDLPLIEDENNTDESQFLNYLALEVEYSYTPAWAIAGRLHHRSGAFEQFGDATGGSNAYLFGLRHRF